MGQRGLSLRSAAALVALHALCASGWSIVPCSLSAMRALATKSSRPGLFPRCARRGQGGGGALFDVVNVLRKLALCKLELT